MPWTLYRYFLRELIKVLALTTVVVVLAISFAASIKPLSDGLLGATGLMRFVFYSSPTFLQFALPFAGAFAGTLVFIRIASDNEILACSASGMSYRSILLPVAGLGLVLTMGLFYLSNWVVPRFYVATATVIERDVTRAIVSSIRRGQAVTLDDLSRSVLYADYAQEIVPEPMPDRRLQPTRQIVLEHVVVGQRDAANQIRSDFTAERADTFLYREDGQTYAVIVLRNFTHYDASLGQFERRDALVRDVELPPVKLRSPFRDNPKFLSWRQLKALGDEPQRYDRIRDVQHDLAERIAMDRLTRTIQAHVRPTADGQGGIVLHGPRQGERYHITAPQARRNDSGVALIGDNRQPVRIDYHNGGVVTRRITARQALLSFERSETTLEPRIRTELSDVRIEDVRNPAAATEHASYELLRSTWPHPLVRPLLQQTSLNELVYLAAQPPYADVRTIRQTRTRLHSEIVRLARRVLAELHARAASAVSCLLLLLLGTTLAIRQRRDMPLVVFFWSCLLAFVTIIIVNTGAQLAEGTAYPFYFGLAVLWSGNLLLAIAVGTIYCILARN